MVLSSLLERKLRYIEIVKLFLYVINLLKLFQLDFIFYPFTKFSTSTNTFIILYIKSSWI